MQEVPKKKFILEDAITQIPRQDLPFLVFDWLALQFTLFMSIFDYCSEHFLLGLGVNNI
jgi:hypothetical protein